MDNDSLLTFPCEFSFKTVGLATAEYELAVFTIIRSYIPDIKEDAIKTRLSHQGKYLAITLTVTVESKEQLDNIYREFTQNEHILVAL